MMSGFRKLLRDNVKRLAANFHCEINRSGTIYSYGEQIMQQERSRIQSALDVLRSYQTETMDQLINELVFAQSQIGQDLFVLSELQLKRDGFFVEFGAASGKELSNTYLLEKRYGWTGILAEPARRWHQAICDNRSCAIETDCVWSKTGESFIFNEVLGAELSTLDQFSNFDLHASQRTGGKKYDVKTISIMDMLRKFEAPGVIDYLSIDTEGSEYDILQSIDYDRYKFKVITCEHNFTSSRGQIFSLLSSHGYVRKLENISQFDDWYVLEH